MIEIRGGKNMKIGNPMKILTPLVAAMFILSLFSGAVVAQTPQDIMDKEKEQYQMFKAKYDNTKDQFEKAKLEFENANKKFQLAKTNLNKDELENKTKEYLTKAIDHTIAHVEVLKTRANNTEDKEGLPAGTTAAMVAHILQLQQLKTKVQTATTVEVLRTANQELKDQVVQINLETRYYLGIVMNNRIGQFIGKAENVSAKLDEAVQKLASQGKDTTQLAEDVKNYKNLLSEASSNHQKTGVLFTSHNGFDSNGIVTDKKLAQAFIQDATNSQKETVRKLRELSRQLVRFVKDFRQLNSGRLNELGGSDSGSERTTATSANTATATTTPNATGTPANNT
jgi:hypothetical protein